jgi:hypothetical protein
MSELKRLQAGRDDADGGKKQDLTLESKDFNGHIPVRECLGVVKQGVSTILIAIIFSLSFGANANDHEKSIVVKDVSRRLGGHDQKLWNLRLREGVWKLRRFDGVFTNGKYSTGKSNMLGYHRSKTDPLDPFIYGFEHTKIEKQNYIILTRRQKTRKAEIQMVDFLSIDFAPDLRSNISILCGDSEDRPLDGLISHVKFPNKCATTTKTVYTTWGVDRATSKLIRSSKPAKKCSWQLYWLNQYDDRPNCSTFNLPE